MAAVWQNALGGLAYGALLFLIAAGFTLILGLMRVVNVAQTSFYLVGAYVGVSLASRGMNFWLVGLLAGLAVAALGLFIYRVFLHRYHADDLTTVLLTLGFVLILGDGTLALWGGDPQSISAPRGLNGPVHLGTVAFPAYWLVLIAVTIVIFAGLWLAERRTLVGAIIRAGVDDEEMLRGLGVDVDRAFYGVFAVGAFLAGLGGWLGGPVTGAYPGMDLALLPLAFAVVIVGGMGSLVGAFVGSMIIGLVNAFGTALFPQLAYFTIFAPVAVIMAWRPEGLFGRK